MSEELLSIPDLGLEPTETPELEIPEVDLETPVEGDASEGPEGEQEEVSSDGRKAPDAIRKALKTFRETNPEFAAAAKTLNEAYSREIAYKAVFPKVADAQAAKATLETIAGFGGVEGVSNTLAEIEEIDALLKEGDPAALDKLVEIAGEGMEKLAPEMLNRLQKSNPDAWERAIKPHLASAIQGVGVPAALNFIYKAFNNAQRSDAPQSFKDEANAQVVEGLKELFKWTQDLGKPDPTQAPAKGDDKLTAREQAVVARENTAFNNEVGSVANAKMNTSLQSALNPYFKTSLKHLTPEGRTDLVQGIYDEVGRLVQSDKTYQEQRKALMGSKNRDASKVAQLMSSKFEQVVGQAAKNVISRRHGKAAPTKTPTAPGSTPVVPGGMGSLANPIKVRENPDRRDVDFSKTTEAMLVKGIRVLKSGKVVQRIN